MSILRVVALDDQQGILDGYRYRLDPVPDVEVVGTARTGSEFEALIADRQPVHVAIMDVSVPTAPDNQTTYPLLYAIPRLQQKYPELSVLVVSINAERPLIEALVDAGASGYILKGDSEAYEMLGNVVKSVAAGGVYFSPTVHNLVYPPTAARGVRLTPRQREVLSLAAAYPGRSLAQLAQMLTVSPTTVRNLLSQSYMRLGVRNRMEAIYRAQELGLIPPSYSSPQPPPAAPPGDDEDPDDDAPPADPRS